MSFSFGAPSTSGAASSSTPAPSLFGNQSAAPSSGFSFGSAQKDNATPAGQPAASGGGLFGGANASKPPGSSLFGGASTTNASPSAGSLFGGAASTGTPPAGGGNSMFSGLNNKPAASPSNVFGGGSSTPSAAAGTSSASPFGSASSSGGLFGAAKPAASSIPSTGASAGNSLFSGAASAGQATPTKPAFGGIGSTTPAGAPPSDSAKPTPSLFSQPAGGQGSQAKGLFSGTAGGTPQASSNLFSGGSTPTSASQPAASNSGSSSLFGNKPAPTESTEKASLFSASTGGTPSSLFGANTATSKPAESSGVNTLFGTKPASTTAAETAPASTAATTAAAAPPSLFQTGSGAATSAAPSKPSLFSTPASTTSAASTTAPAAAPAPASTPSLFSTTTATAPAASASTAAPSTGASSLFGAKSAATTASAPGTTTTASTNFGALGSGAAPMPAGAGTEKAATQGAGQSNMAASTMGPPSQLPRLKNKTMDEIITRWATDLQKYQKEFKDQATKVAAWDRLLVENGEKIQKLYLQTHEAEKASNEIDRQLQSVESHQAELESFLDRYEKEVDDMYSKQIGGNEQLAGPDQERERTYKLAENLTDRLDEMGKDLGKMITEINDISGSLSKGNKPDDPLSQIVRVLNGHLQQLQWIDTNASALQAKVNAAQKASNNIGSKYGNPDSDAADGFYRSYMGRR